MTSASDASARKRLPQPELRRRILDAGQDLLASGGLTVGLQHLNMEQLIRRVGLPRSSVFAAFGGKEELVTELMVHALRNPGGGTSVGFSNATVETAMSVLAAHADRMRDAAGDPDPAGQEAVLAELVRRVLQVNIEDTTTSTQWQTYMALSVSVRSLPPGRRERVREALQEADARFIDEMAGVYRHVLSAVGRRPREGYTIQRIATICASLIEGLVARRLIGSADAAAVVTRPGLDGEPVEWPIGAVAFFALLQDMTERVD